MEIRFAVMIFGDLEHTHDMRGLHGYAPELSLILPMAILVRQKRARLFIARGRNFIPEAMSRGFTRIVLLEEIFVVRLALV